MITKKEISLRFTAITKKLKALDDVDSATRNTLTSFVMALNNIALTLDATLKALDDHNIEVDLPDSVKSNKTLTS